MAGNQSYNFKRLFSRNPKIRKILDTLHTHFITLNSYLRSEKDFCEIQKSKRDTGVPRIEGFKDILELRASDEKKKTYHEHRVNLRSTSNRNVQNL